MSQYLGDWVTFDQRFERQEQYRDSGERGLWGARLKQWAAVSCSRSRGVLAGLRTLRDGSSEWEGEDVGWVWAPNGITHSAALVVTDIYRKPILVPSDNLMQLLKSASLFKSALTYLPIELRGDCEEDFNWCMHKILCEKDRYLLLFIPCITSDETNGSQLELADEAQS